MKHTPRNKTEAGNGWNGIRRVIDGCQRAPGAALRVAFGKRCPMALRSVPARRRLIRVGRLAKMR